MEFYFFVCIFFTLTNQLCLCQEPVGCGGFLRPPNKISYRQVSIKLYYPDGSLRSTTDVSPNGAYTIPIYDYGDYVIKVDPPEGWTFEPVEGYSIAVKGRDSCSKDFNFQFAGFSLQGKILTRGLNSGPSGIMINLEEETTKQLMTAPVATTEGGKFEFFKIMPGNYRLGAKHSTVQFVVQEVIVKMSADGTTNMENVIMTRGNSVSLGVTSDQMPIKGVLFFVYPLDNQDLLLKSDIPNGCVTATVAEFRNPYPSAPFCHVISDEKGHVSLGPLPGGRYTLVPYYRGESNLVFDVQPNSLTINMAHESIKLSSHAFQVVGYAVSGRVVVAQGGAGVARARVLMENKNEVLTDAEGRFTIEGMRSGSFMLTVSAENMEFEPRRVQVSASASRLTDVVAARFSVCGQVVIDKAGAASIVSDERQIVVESAKDQRQLMSVTARGEDGSFCAFLSPGTYLLRALVSQREDELGFRLAPVHHEVHVSTTPVSGLRFSQFRALISGSVDCLDVCPALRLFLTSSGAAVTGDSKTLELGGLHQVSQQWQFVDVMPGRYSLRLEEIGESRSCWQGTEKTIEVLDKDLDQIAFAQNGYRVIVASSHAAQLFYAHESITDTKGQQNLHKGAQSLCLPFAGNYTLSATSCHKLEQAQWRYDTSLSSNVNGPLSVVASQHQITVVIELDAAVTDLQLRIEYEGNAQLNHVMGPLQMEPGSLKVSISLWESINTVLRVTPLSQLTLFDPPTSTVAVSGVECNPTVAVLRGKLGTFVLGEVQPPLADVEITLAGDLVNSAMATAHTDKQGHYRFGPLPRAAQYTVSARKLGYKFSSIAQSANESAIDALERRRDFKLFKLAEVLVDIRDSNGKPLGGVLLSVSGDDFRGSELTDADGRYRFLGLTPGIYYVRAAMKEYHFSLQNAGEVHVEEGRAVTLQGRGEQVAFTASGVVLSLNGEPEPNLVMEAVSEATAIDQRQQSCTPGHVESGSTDSLGHFRLRGLQPGCRYIIQLRTDAPSNTIIERTSPAQLHVVMPNGDLPALHFYAFRRLQLLHLSASVDTPLKEHVSTLRLQIFPENAPHRVLLTHHLAKSPLLFTSDLPADGKRYVMRLESTLPSSLWSGAGPQEMSFRALGVEQSGALHLRIQFRPQRRMSEPDVAASSFFVLPLALLVALAFYYRKNLLPYKDPVVDYLRATIQLRLFGSSTGSSASSGGASPRHHSSQYVDPNDLSDISPELLRPLPVGSAGMVNFGFRGGKTAKAKARKT